MVMVACGPFTPSDSLAYDPLIDLINIINKDRPDVCILVRVTCMCAQKLDVFFNANSPIVGEGQLV